MCFFGSSSKTQAPPPPPPAPVPASAPIPMAERLITEKKRRGKKGVSFKRRGRYALRTDKSLGGYAQSKGVNIPS